MSLLNAISRTRARGLLLLIIIAPSVVGLDQLTKYLIRANMDLGESMPAEGFFRLTHTTNTGGAFSILANQGFLLTVTALLGIAILVIYLRYLPLESRLLKIGLGLEFGGAVGNLIDRVRFGEVTDFIDVGAWPVFNVADSALTVGTVLIIYYLIFVAGRKAT
jgi:signal peptidase II